MAREAGDSSASASRRARKAGARLKDGGGVGSRPRALLLEFEDESVGDHEEEGPVPPMFTGKDLADVPPHVIHFHFNQLYDRLMSERYPGFVASADGADVPMGEVLLAPRVPVQVFNRGEEPQKAPYGASVGSKRGRSDVNVGVGGADAGAARLSAVAPEVRRPRARHPSEGVIVPGQHVAGSGGAVHAIPWESQPVRALPPYPLFKEIVGRGLHAGLPTCTKGNGCTRPDRHRGRCASSAYARSDRPASGLPVSMSDELAQCSKSGSCTRPNRHRGPCSMGKSNDAGDGLTKGTTRGRGRPRSKPASVVRTMSSAVRRKLLPDLRLVEAMPRSGGASASSRPAARASGVLVAQNASNGVFGFDNGKSVYVAPDLDASLVASHEIHGLPPSVTNVFVLGGIANPTVSVDRRPRRGRAPDRVNRAMDDMRNPPVFRQDRRPRPPPAKAASKNKAQSNSPKKGNASLTAFDALIKDLGLAP